MKRNLMIFLMAALLLTTISAFAQPQLQLQALLAPSGPAYRIQVQGPRVVTFGDVGFFCFEYDSVQQSLNLRSVLQAPHTVGTMIFHPTLPLLYVMMDKLNSFQQSGLLIIDLSDPENPQFYDPTNLDFSEISSFDIQGDSLYIFKSDSLYIFNNLDPWNPRLVVTTNIGISLNQIRINGNFLHGTFISGMLFHGKYGMMDISDPANPIFCASDQYSWPTLLDVGGGHSAINVYNQPLMTYQIQETSPYLIGPTYHSGKNAPAKCTSEGSIYAQGANGIYKYTNSNWTWTGVDTTVYNFEIRGDLVFVNKALPKTEVWRLNTGNAVLLDSFNYSPVHPWAVALKDNVAIIPGENGSLLFYNILEPTNPVLISQIASVCGGGAMCISGNYLYINGTSIMAVVDISDIFQPHLVTNIVLPSMGASGMITTNDTLVFISGMHRIVAYDITNPEIPLLVANHYEPSYFYKLIHAQRGCLISSSNNLYKIYRADQDLQLLSTISAGSDDSPFIAGKGDSLIIGDHFSFRIYSITNPTSPEFLDQVTLPGMNPSSYNAAFDGTYL